LWFRRLQVFYRVLVSFIWASRLGAGGSESPVQSHRTPALFPPRPAVIELAWRNSGEDLLKQKYETWTIPFRSRKKEKLI
jgi:hypothetical protein